jgi:hypothetical protein
LEHLEWLPKYIHIDQDRNKDSKRNDVGFVMIFSTTRYIGGGFGIANFWWIESKKTNSSFGLLKFNSEKIWKAINSASLLAFSLNYSSNSSLPACTIWNAGKANLLLATSGGVYNNL